MTGNEGFSIDQLSQYRMFLSMYEGGGVKTILASVAFRGEM